MRNICWNPQKCFLCTFPYKTLTKAVIVCPDFCMEKSCKIFICVPSVITHPYYRQQGSKNLSGKIFSHHGN